MEEPPQSTIFLLVTEDEEQIISTITSRCQALHFGNLSVKQIADYLMDYEDSWNPNKYLKNCPSGGWKSE